MLGDARRGRRRTGRRRRRSRTSAAAGTSPGSSSRCRSSRCRSSGRARRTPPRPGRPAGGPAHPVAGRPRPGPALRSGHQRSSRRWNDVRRSGREPLQRVGDALVQVVGSSHAVIQAHPAAYLHHAARGLDVFWTSRRLGRLVGRVRRPGRPHERPHAADSGRSGRIPALWSFRWPVEHRRPSPSSQSTARDDRACRCAQPALNRHRLVTNCMPRPGFVAVWDQTARNLGGEHSHSMVPGRLAGDVEGDPVDLAHLVGDAGGDRLEHVVRQPRPVGGHRVLGGDRAQHDRVAVGAAVALDADRADVGEQHDRELPDVAVEAGAR